MKPEDNRSEIVKEAYYLVDPKSDTPFEKSRTAFISLATGNGSITMSAFLARAMGIVSGDRIGLINSRDNPLKWLIFKTNQREGTKEVRIRNGVYKMNNLQWTRKLGQAFRFNMEYSGLIRLYVNMEDKIKIPHMDEAYALQLYDLPLLREDFKTPEEQQAYCDYVDANPYIIKVNKDEPDTDANKG